MSLINSRLPGALPRFTKSQCFTLVPKSITDRDVTPCFFLQAIVLHEKGFCPIIRQLIAKLVFVVAAVLVLNAIAVFAASVGSEVSLYIVNPITKQKILPNTPINSFPLARNQKNVISVKACRGEFEPSSFVVRSTANLTGVSVVSSGLKGPDGSSISQESVDIRLVKCWHQGGSGSVARGATTLTPELLLKDDSLIKIDEQDKKNFLKIRVGGKDEYIDITKPNLKFPEGAEIHDANSLSPFDVPANTNKQVLLTFHVPVDATPGDYTGTLSVSSGEKLLNTITIQLTVLPFDLQKAAIEYSLYYTGRYSPLWLLPLHHQSKTFAQYAIDLQNMKDHGVLYPTMYQPALAFAEKEFEIRKSLGLPTDKLYFLGISTEGPLIKPENLHKLKDRISEWKSLVQAYGYKDLYIYGHDEAKGEALLAQRNAWQAAHDAGAKVFVAGYEGAVDVVGDLLDLIILAGEFKPKEVEKWHKRGKKVFIYANPQVGVEDPETYRRNYGIPLLCNGYDGVMNYAYQHESGGNIWNDFDDKEGRDHVFAYPASDRVIDTIQWEGFREAVDDVRYLTTLANLIGASAYQSVCKDVLPESDLGSVRETIIKRIISKQ